MKFYLKQFRELASFLKSNTIKLFIQFSIASSNLAWSSGSN